MGYRVQYSDEEPPRSKAFRFWLTAVFFLIFLLAVDAHWPEGREVLRRILFPGRGSEAAEAFASDVEAGTSLIDALTRLWRRLWTAVR